MKKVIVLVLAITMLSGCFADVPEASNVPMDEETVNQTTTIQTTTKKKADWKEKLPKQLCQEIESAFSEIGENPDNIVNVEYQNTKTTGYVFERKNYKVEFSWSLGNPGYKHSRYYLITTQNYFDGEPEKEQYPDEFLVTIRYWVGEDGQGTNVNQWTWTGTGEMQN